MKKLIFLCLGITLLLAATGFNYFSKALQQGGDMKEINVANFDTTVKPQQDFYHYVNGTWLKNNPIPGAEAAWGSFNQVADSNTAHLRKILEEAAKNKNNAPGSIEQKVGDFFAMIMDSDKTTKEGITPLNPELEKIKAIHDDKSFWTEVASLMKMGPDVMFGFGVGQDAKNSTKEICQTSQGGISLPSKDYYLDSTPRMMKIRAAYFDYVQKLFMQMNEPKDVAQADAQKVMDIETAMAKISKSRVELRDVQASYNKMTFADFEKMTPNIDWNTCLSIFGIKSIDSIIVTQPAFSKGLSRLVKSMPMDDWKAYLRYHLVHSEASKLGDTLYKISFDFWGRTLSGVREMQPRWKRAVQGTSGALGQLLGQLYVAKYFSPEAKNRVEEMVHNIIATYKERINQLAWMSPETKKYAMAKLDKIMLKLCYPDKWRDYSALQIKRDAYVLNSFRVEEWNFNYDISKLGKPVDRTEWGMSPQTVNAYYNPGLNEIVFPAGIMQPPFFDPKRDDAMNYGAMGGIIGHELTHGFDDQGSQFDAEGNLHKWWTNQDSTLYTGRLAVLIKQFDGYMMDSAQVNGHLTIGENTADLGGLTIAYYALQKDLKAHPEGVVQGFTPEQRFFISWAQGWRMNIRPAYLRQLVSVDPHSPAMFRVNGPMSDMPEFYKAFNVKAGDGMYRPDDQRATIW
jgi:putative endopeptidase